MTDICMYGCRSCNFSCKYCMGPDKSRDEEFVLDESNLLESIKKYRASKTVGTAGFVIWGGEPLLHFPEFKRTVKFLQKNFPAERLMVSTNGFLLQQVEIQNYILDNKIKIQLSVDGVAQSVRSAFNPLDDDLVSIFLSKLAKNGLLTINCTMHNQNYSVNANIKYFTEWMEKYDCLNSKLNIRLTPFNESNLTPEFNLSGERLRTFIDEFESLYIKSLLGSPKDRIYRHFRKYPLNAIKQSNLEVIQWEDFNQCSRFYAGKIPMTKHIDTKGNFVSCNLIDSNIDPRGQSVKKMPDYCNGCEFQGMRGCWPCPAGDFAETCDWKKEWMRLQKRMLLLKRFVQKKLP